MLLLEDDNFVLLEDGSNLLFEKYFFEEIGTGGLSIDGNATEVVECCDLIVKNNLSIELNDTKSCIPRLIESDFAVALTSEGIDFFGIHSTAIQSVLNSAIQSANESLEREDYQCDTDCGAIIEYGSSNESSCTANVSISLAYYGGESCGGFSGGGFEIGINLQSPLTNLQVKIPLTTYDGFYIPDNTSEYFNATGSAEISYDSGGGIIVPFEPFGGANENVISALNAALIDLGSIIPTRLSYCGGCFDEFFSVSKTIGYAKVDLELDLRYGCISPSAISLTVQISGNTPQTWEFPNFGGISLYWDVTGKIDLILDCPVRGKGILSIDGTGTNHFSIREFGNGAVAIDGTEDVVERTIGVGILEINDDSIVSDTHSITGDGIVSIDDDSIDHVYITETSDGSVSIDGDHTIVERTIGVGILEVSGDPDVSDTHSITGNGIIEIDDDSEIIFSHIGMGILEISGDELVILKTKQKEIIIRANKLQEDHSNFLMAIRCEIVGEDFLIQDIEDKTLTHHITSYEDDILTMYFNCDLSSDIDNYFYLYSVEYS